MITIYLNFSLRKKINFNPFGISIKKISKSIKNKLYKDLQEITKYKTDIKDFYEKNKDISEFDLYHKINMISDNSKIKSIYLTSFQLLKSGFQFNEDKIINNIIDKLAIIEINEDKISKYVNKKDINDFLSKILLTSQVCESPLLDKKINYSKDYKYVIEDTNIFENDEAYIQILMLNFVFKYKNNNIILKEIYTSYSFLLKFEKFINNLTDEELEKFCELIELLFNNYNKVSNRILSNVTLVESLIINEKDNIEKSFILKGGIILKNTLKVSNELSNKNISDLLKFTYNIRSDIIHGNYSKIEKDLNSINQKNHLVKKFVDDKDKLSKKERALNIADIISLLLARSIFKEWIENKANINFLKLN